MFSEKTDPISREPNMTNEIWTFQRPQMMATKASVRLDKKPRNGKMSPAKGQGRTPAPQRDACSTASVVLCFTITREYGKWPL